MSEISEIVRELEKYEEFAPLSCLSIHPETPGYTTGTVLRDTRAARELIQRLSAEIAEAIRIADAKEVAAKAYYQNYRDEEARANVAEARLAEAVEVLQWLDRLGGLGYEKHDRIRAVLNTPAK